jgi:hypothetical protein
VFKYYNNDQADAKQNTDISGLVKYATADYGSNWADTEGIAAALLLLYPVPDIAILRNTNGTGSSRVYIHAAAAWEALATATIADGGVTLAKLATGILAASATGRAAIADNFFDAATILAKIADGAFAADANTLALFGDGIWTLAKMAATAKTHVLTYQVEDLGAGDDITDRVIFAAPTGLDVTITGAFIIPQGAAAGIDDSNTCVIALTDGTNTIVSATYDSDPAFPAAAAVTSLGTPDETHKALAAGEKLYLAVTTGTTANPPAFMLQVTYTVADAA